MPATEQRARSRNGGRAAAERRGAADQKGPTLPPPRDLPLATLQKPTGRNASAAAKETEMPIMNVNYGPAIS